MTQQTKIRPDKVTYCWRFLRTPQMIFAANGVLKIISSFGQTLVQVSNNAGSFRNI
jgi:hypothetical protein